MTNDQVPITKVLLVAFFAAFCFSVFAGTTTINGNLSVTGGVITINGARVPTTNDLAGFGAGSSNLPVAVTTTSALLTVVTTGGTNIELILNASIATNYQWLADIVDAVNGSTNISARVRQSIFADATNSLWNNFAGYLPIYGGGVTNGTFALFATDTNDLAHVSAFILELDYCTFGPLGNALTFQSGVATFDSTVTASHFIGDGSGLSNVGTTVYATIGSLANYARIVSVPTNFTAYGELNWIAKNATNLFWYDGTRWRKSAVDTTGGW